MSTPLPQHCPTPRELDDLELLLGGALAPRTRFDDAADPGAVITLHLPEELRDVPVELVDPEGLPLARREADGSLTSLSVPAYGPFRRLYLTPAQARSQYGGRSWVPVTDALTHAELNRVRQRGPLVLLTFVGHGSSRLGAVGLLRATLAAAEELPDAVVVAVPLAAHDGGEADVRLREQVTATYAGADAVWPLPERIAAPRVDDFVESVAAVVAHHAPEPGEQGLVLFFTGLSGSGKSTLARALMDRILEQGVRTVTSLDGDVVRRNLSAGLTFSKADRETNIRRIGWVAAEVSRHGGVAVVSPIAPFDETRQQVRQMVDDAGGKFFLVHVATPLEECERRDRKGLYAKARRGEIPEFTGISSPYEEPTDADVVVDTTGRSIEDALDDVVRALADSGHLDVRRRGAQAASESAAGAVAQEPTDALASIFEPVAPTSRAQTSEGRVRVVFVCTANVCRSPYMELSTPTIVGDALEVASFGTGARPRMRMDSEIAAFLPDGATPKGFRSDVLHTDFIDAADVVLTAEQSHVEELLEQRPTAFRKIFTLGQFAETVAGSDLRGRELIEWAGEFRAPATPEQDIPDPFGNGREAAEQASLRITELLKVALPPLAGA